MPQGTRIPITPSVLAWAIEASGFTRAEVAEKLKVPLPVLSSWEQAKEAPSLSVARKLATVLKRQLAVLLLPEPPRVAEPEVRFRAAPGSPRTTLSPEERLRLRQAARLQEMTAWLSHELHAPAASIPSISASENPHLAGEHIRSTWSMTVTQQMAWPNDSQAAARWRESLEAVGVTVLLLPLGKGACRGFSLNHSTAPVIGVNTYWRGSVRAFTLFHEFAHLVSGTPSACLGIVSAIRPTDPVERWCERFAASFLMPTAPFEAAVRLAQPHESPSHVDDIAVVGRIANRFRVSLRAAALRCIELGLSDWSLYERIDEAADAKSGFGAKGGRNRAQIKEDQLGRRVEALFVDGVERSIISTSEALSYLDIPASAFQDLLSNAGE